MPFVVQKSAQCPVSRQWGVFTETGHQTGKTVGKPHGCHTSRESGLKQAAALYVNVPDERSEVSLPPGLRNSTSKTERCGLCRMYDDGECWGYGNIDVRPDQVCDSFEPESETKSEPGSPEVHMTLTESPVLTPNTAEWREERARSISESQRKRPESRQVHEPLELREATDDGKRTLRSYASLFNEPYTIRSAGHRFQEVVRPGAFKRTLGTNPDVVFRTEHSGPPLAATWSKDLRLGEDERGLWYEVDLDTTDPDVQSLIAKVQRGVYRESSFAFRIPQNGDRWSEERDQREVMACELDRGDVSVVTFGASRGTGKHMLLRAEEEAVAALQEIGFKRFLEVFVEWRNFTLLPLEERVGKVISSTSMESLRQVLGLIADADDAVDEAEAMLADFLGVPNPDEGDETKSEADVPEERADPTMEDYGVMSALREAHLVLAHVKAKQLADPDNDKDPDDKAVMAEIVSAQGSIEKAIVAQSKDGRPDPRPADKSARSEEERTEPTAVVEPETPPEPAAPAVVEETERADVAAPDSKLIETALAALQALRVTAPAPVEANAEAEADETLAAAVASENGATEAEAAEAEAQAEEAEEGDLAEYWLLSQDDVPEEDRADLSASGRQSMAKAGTARPDGSFPIPNVAYLKRAIQAFGRAADKPAVKAWIIKRAKALGASDLIPDSWRSDEEPLPLVRLAENDSAELLLELDYQRLGLGKN